MLMGDTISLGWTYRFAPNAPADKKAILVQVMTIILTNVDLSSKLFCGM